MRKALYLLGAVVTGGSTVPLCHVCTPAPRRLMVPFTPGVDSMAAMRLDIAAFKMAFEAYRQSAFGGLDALALRPLSPLPAVLQEAYRRGGERGVLDAMEFEPADFREPPPELDWEFAGAWRLGYSDGIVVGTLRREVIWNHLTAQVGFDP